MEEFISMDKLIYRDPTDQPAPIEGLDELEMIYVQLLMKAKEIGDLILEKREKLKQAFDEGGKKPWVDPYTEDVDTDKLDYLVSEINLSPTLDNGICVSDSMHEDKQDLHRVNNIETENEDGKTQDTV